MRFKELIVVCGAAGRGGICEDLGCVEFVLENLRTKGIYPVLRKRVGNMVYDPVSNALIIIKNGYKAYKSEVLIPYSKLILQVVKLLEKEGYISSQKEVKDSKNAKMMSIQIGLKYEDKAPAVSEVKRISKPGLRVYKGSKELPRVLNGLGIAIISTPKGVMSDKEARKEKVGGEVMAYVW